MSTEIIELPYGTLNYVKNHRCTVPQVGMIPEDSRGSAVFKCKYCGKQWKPYYIYDCRPGEGGWDWKGV